MIKIINRIKRFSMKGTTRKFQMSYVFCFHGVCLQCQLETVRLLDLVCKVDSAQIPKTFRELKRLVKDSSHDENSPKRLIAILQFLLNHSKQTFTRILMAQTNGSNKTYFS